MLERLISETKDRHSKQAISQEAYNKWLRNGVTRRLFEDLELGVIDSFQDWLPNDPNEALCVAKEREGASKLVDTILDWSPAGVEGPNDEEDS